MSQIWATTYGATSTNSYGGMLAEVLKHERRLAYEDFVKESKAKSPTSSHARLKKWIEWKLASRHTIKGLILGVHDGGNSLDINYIEQALEKAIAANVENEVFDYHVLSGEEIFQSVESNFFVEESLREFDSPTCKFIVKVKKLHSDAIIPKRATEGSVGYDLYLVEESSNFAKTYASDGVVLLSTGLAFEIPHGYEGQVRLRSSLGKKGFSIPNGVGTIDSDYRGEVMIILTHRYPSLLYNFKKGDKVAQILFKKVELPEVIEVSELSETDRGEGGFGSTGK